MELALRFVLRTHCGSTQPVVIISDSRSALQAVFSPRPSYKNVVYDIHNIISSYKGTVLFQWVKAHCGVRGNEIADKAANLGHSNDRSTHILLEYEEAITCIQRGFQSRWTNTWREAVTRTGKGRFLASIYSELLLFNYISRNTKFKTPVATLKSLTGGVEEDYGKAELLSKQGSFRDSIRTY